ncbi:MAG: redox-sensing transcriptional repressor Rex [Candidatus Bipolaricaulota bacterium]
MKKLTIPKETIGRLPFYLRQLEKLREEGEEFATSQQITENLPGIQANSLRKDLTYFGSYGTRGTGYSVPRLIKELKSLLKLKDRRKVALVGVGYLGTALLNYHEFGHGCFDITLAFDKDPSLIDREVKGVQIEDPEVMESRIKGEDIEVAIIAVPSDQAQPVADSLVSAGIEGVLNFAPVLLDLPEEIRVFQIDITSKLEEMNFYL